MIETIGCYVSSEEPKARINGDCWYRTSDGAYFQWDEGQWVEIASAPDVLIELRNGLAEEADATKRALLAKAIDEIERLRFTIAEMQIEAATLAQSSPSRRRLFGWL